MRNDRKMESSPCENYWRTCTRKDSTINDENQMKSDASCNHLS